MKNTLSTDAGLREKLDAMPLSDALTEESAVQVHATFGGAGLATAAADQDLPDLSRIKAAEILMRSDFVLLADLDPLSLGKAYSGVIESRELGADNPFGLVGEAPGPLAEMFVYLESPAIPALRELLNDSRPLLYEGSEEPTLSEMYQYRVKDLAGWIICLIRETEFDWTVSIEERDRFISEELSN